MGIKINVVMTDDRWKVLKVSLKGLIRKIFGLCFFNNNSYIGRNFNFLKNKKLIVVFAEKGLLQEINLQHRNLDKPTDIVSLSIDNFIDGKDELIGEIYLSFDNIMEYKRINKVYFFDRVRHLLVHGVLHILNHNHKTDFGYYSMSKIERLVLRFLKTPESYIQRFV